MGGEAVTIPGSDRSIADDVVAYAHANNVTQIIIGKSTRSRWFEILYGSVVHDLVRRAGNISVHVIAGDEPGEPIPRKTVRTADKSRTIDAIPYVVALLAVAAALGVGLLIHPWFGIENVDLVFLTAIVAIAVRFGLWPSLVASIAASLAYNFFFMPPLYTLTIAEANNVAAFVFFIVMATLVSNVAARVRTQAMSATGRARATEFLYAFSRKLAGVGTLDDVLWATAYQIALMLKVRVVVLLPKATPSPSRPAIRRRTCWTTPMWPQPRGRSRTIALPGAVPTRCRGRNGCSCPCAPAAAPSALSASTATSPVRC